MCNPLTTEKQQITKKQMLMQMAMHKHNSKQQ